MKIFLLLITFFTSSCALQSNYVFVKDVIKKDLYNKIEKDNIIDKNLKFKKVKVAVIDTGIDLNNPYLNNKKFNYKYYTNDYHGHGSHVQGTISLLTNKSIEIKHYPFNLDNPKTFLKQLNKAVNDNVDIINISGGSEGSIYNERKLIRIAEKKNIIVVVAAGNYNKNLDFIHNNYFPASYKNKNILSVANYKNKKNIHKSSNYGKSVTIGTIGTSIPGFCKEMNHQICYMTGTSQSTPIITSAISIIKSRYPQLSLQEIKKILKFNSTKNKYTNYGYFNYNHFIKWINKNKNIKRLRKDLNKL